jgi:hypothetical protein
MSSFRESIKGRKGREKADSGVGMRVKETRMRVIEADRKRRGRLGSQKACQSSAKVRAKVMSLEPSTQHRYGESTIYWRMHIYFKSH